MLLSVCRSLEKKNTDIAFSSKRVNAVLFVLTLFLSAPSDCRRHAGPHARVDGLTWSNVCSGGPVDSFPGYVDRSLQPPGSDLLCFTQLHNNCFCCKGRRV